MKPEKYNVDLSEAVWSVSTRSGDSNCVSVAFVSGMVAVRDSKSPDYGPVLIFTPEEWKAFIGVDGESGGVKGGQFDI